MIKLEVGVLDAELAANNRHEFPNLACMKLSAYHKGQGDSVKLLTDYSLIDDCQKVYVSKVFTDTDFPDELREKANVICGGTGFYYENSPDLDEQIEHIKPDYSLYDKWAEENDKTKYFTDYSIGFTTRGCFRQCEFCVNKKYKRAVRHARVDEFLDKDKKYICLLDDNVFAYHDWKGVFDELQDTEKPFQFKQGLDIRLLTDEKAERLVKVKYKGDYIFAFDDLKDRELIKGKLKLWNKHRGDKSTKLYVLCAYAGTGVQDIIELFERIKILLEHKCLPYVMRYKDYNSSKYRGMYITLARWCNQPSLVKKMSLREFVERDGESVKSDNWASKRYITQFEYEHPELAEKYFDMRWGKVVSSDILSV